MSSQFEKDVLAGLSCDQKYLSSKYFYNKRGDELFQSIMAMPEYYLTRAEYQIFEHHKNRILEIFNSQNRKFKLIEFGAGDGSKTKVLLEYFSNAKVDFEYAPIDISKNVLLALESDLMNILPNLEVEIVNDDYFKGLEALNDGGNTREVVLFLGSNLGNFRDAMAHKFLSGISSRLNRGDLFLIGLDLKKDPAKILAAYNDEAGITSDFNLNLLQRINDELGGDFVIDQFKHYPTYNPDSGETTSYLISTKDQNVTLAKSGRTFHFKAWEPIFMEVSQKYDLDKVNDLAENTGFEVVEHLFDENRFFVDSIWQVK